MYDKLKELIAELGVNYNYRTAKENRSLLQLIREEAKAVRVIILNDKIKGTYDEKPVEASGESTEVNPVTEEVAEEVVA